MKIKSWKTTTAAILGFVALMATQTQAAFDGNPQTVANWNIVIAGIMPLVGLFFANDDSKAA